MGLTLTFQEMGSVFTRQPQLLLLGMALQYTVLPTIGYAISKWCAGRLSPATSVPRA
jgi:BASS family bile acid:Na+ symporter